MNTDLIDMFFKDDHPLSSLKPIILLIVELADEPGDRLRAFKRALMELN